jgi:NADPH2:quinone reductase
MQRIEITKTGAPEVMQLVEAQAIDPGPGEARVRHSRIGVNFIDTYHRGGIYPMQLPSGIGMEAAGHVEAVGEGVAHVRPGDRVVYFTNSPGSYATHRTLAARWLVKLPDDVPDDVAAAIWLKACTVEFLVERCAKVSAGDTVLVPAAAGGVGILLCQWLADKGATVIGTVGADSKVETARKAGCHHVLAYADVPTRVRELTGGRGVDVVIDGVGKASFWQSLDALRRRGLLISYGNASGKVGEVDFGILAAKGSLFTTRPTLFDYYAEDADFEAGAAAVLDRLQRGVIAPVIGQTFPLADAVRCHQALEARETIGSSLLIP